MDDELEGLKVVFEANLDDLNGAPGQMDSIFGAVESSAAAASDAITSSVQGVAHSFDALEISGDNLSEHLAKIQPFDAGKSISDVDVAQAKLALIESDVDKAREHLQKLQNAANAGEAVTGIPEAEAKLTLLEKKAQDARENVQKLAQEEQSAGSAAESFASSENEAASSASNLASHAREAGESVGEGGFLGGIKKAISGLLDFPSKIGMAVFGLQQIGQTATSVASSLLRPAASAEQLQGSLEVFTGSAQKAKQEMQDLNVEASHSPFKTTDVDQFALKLQSVGIAAQDVIPDFQALGDGLDAIGRTSSADLSQLTGAFIKIQTEGHLSTDVMNSFAEMGIDAWSVLEKQTGKTHEALQAYISQGLYGAKDAMHDLTTGMEENPLYHGQMANDASVFNGVLSTLQSNWNQLLVGFGSPIIKGLEPLLANASNALSSPAFTDFAGGVGQSIVNVFSGIGKAGEYVGGMLKTLNLTDFKEAWSSLAGLLGDIEGRISKVGGAFNFLKTDADPVAETIQHLAKDGLSLLSNVLQGIDSVLMDFDKSLAGVPGPVSQAGDSLKEFLGPAQNIASMLGGQFVDAFKFAGTEVKQISTWFAGSGILQDMGQEFQNVGHVLLDLGEIFIKARGVIQDVEENAFARFAPVIERILPLVVGLGTTIDTDVVGAFNYVTPYVMQAEEAFGQFAEGVTDRVEPIIEKYLPYLEEGAKELKQGWDEVFPYLKVLTQDVFQNIAGTIQTDWAIISGIINIGLDILGGNWKQAGLDLQGMWKGMWDGMNNMTGGKLKELQDTISGGVKWVQDEWKAGAEFVVDKFDWLYNHNYYFKQLVDAIKKDVHDGEEFLKTTWDGIRANLGLKWNEIKGDGAKKSAELWDGISGPFRNAWGYVSGPIDGFKRNLSNTIGGWENDAYQWGKNLIQGFVNGIEGMVGNARNAANDVMHSVAGILGFHSPAREGEGTKLLEWGPNLVKGFSQGMESAIPQLQSSLNLVMKPVASTLSSAPISASGLATFAQRPLQGNSGNVTHIHIHLDEREFAEFLVDPLMDKVVKRLRLQGGRMVAV